MRGNPINTSGELPTVGAPAPTFTLTGTDLGEVGSDQFRGKPVLLNVFPSVDTPVCATSVRTFNERVAGTGVAVLCVSNDLPRYYFRSNRSLFITLLQAAAKSFTNFSFASELA